MKATFLEEGLRPLTKPQHTQGGRLEVAPIKIGRKQTLTVFYLKCVVIYEKKFAIVEKMRQNRDDATYIVFC